MGWVEMVAWLHHGRGLGRAGRGGEGGAAEVRGQVEAVDGE